MSKKVMLILGLVTLFGFSIVGFLIAYFFQDRTWKDLFNEEQASYSYQLISGLIFGAVASANIVWLLYNKILSASRNYFSKLISNFNLSIAEVIFLSFCAGVGEEIFFRGVLQHWLGIWFTAVLFVGLHGYLNPRDWRMLIYGLLMVIISAGFGYLYMYRGLVAAILAHFIIDVVIFICLQYFPAPPEEQHSD